ncbi:hypothetical protein ACFQBQ_05990 [Granulicella cerasi]|uniref:Membrane protein NfeD2 N-terminal transmembrane domain-containing protein n=1 Tax=Granulicella cerasi TaxID=741063 RepID=A0ABW1Z7K6_9BACT|nr:hypothetical protein [Granulicella cerasi]
MNGFDWNTLYLTCFVLGLAFSLLAVVSGSMHMHIGHFHFGHGHGAGHQHHAMSWLNAFTITGFLCWFGGAGYLFHRAHVFTAIVVLGFAILAGLAGAGILLWFLTGVLLKHERTLEPEDTEIVGVLGRISQPVREGGVGEMLYTQNGSRRSVGVRSVDGAEIAKGTEVIVMSFARGIAQVRRWDEFQHGLMDEGEATPVERE